MALCARDPFASVIYLLRNITVALSSSYPYSDYRISEIRSNENALRLIVIAEKALSTYIYSSLYTLRIYVG